MTLPGAGFITVTVAVIDTALKLWGSGVRCHVGVVAGALRGLCAVVILVVLAKWIIVGRYRPFTQPFWSTFVWRLELVNALFEFLATPIGLEALRGTPCSRGISGCSARGSAVAFILIRPVSLSSTFANRRSVDLNRDCTLQTHLFEDRVLKASSSA